MASGRRRIVAIAHPDDGGRSGDVSGDGEDPQREVVEVLLRLGDLVARHRARQRFGEIAAPTARPT